MKNYCKNRGFTLVELMVSVTITAILMVGMATFFSSTFRNMFMAREKVTNSQGQFVVNTILGGKFVNVDKLQALGPSGNSAVLRNDMETGDLPFTYIGKKEIDGADHIVFKDFFVFNGRDGSDVSTDSLIKNPAGIATGLMNEIYLTAPLENKIYRCGFVVSACDTLNPLNISGLNQPMDIDSNGVNTLYVADAGNNRVIAITAFTSESPGFVEVATDLNYPTGVAYYSPSPSQHFLFVADTYNHLVKRIDLDSGIVKTVVGDGDDKICNPTPEQPEHSAIFCKLNFPTDVLVGDVGGIKSLYIADTGNGRVLKVSDPDPDLSNHKILASIDSSIKISRIDFVFPAGTTINSATEISNTLHKGRYKIVSPIISYYLSSTSIGDTMDNSFSHEICVPAPPDPDVCVDYYHHRFLGFTPADPIFASGDSITIDDDSYDVSDETVAVSPPNPDNINANSVPEIKYGLGVDVKITNEFSGAHEFYFDLENVDFASGFNLIETKIYDELDVLNNDPPDFQTLRIGDGVLGTFEDTIEVVEIGSQTEFDFPTGLSSIFGVGPLSVSDSPDYDTDFSSVGYDYVSDFEVNNLSFDKSNNDTVLEMEFDAKIGEDPNKVDPFGAPLKIWEENTLNAKIK